MIDLLIFITILIIFFGGSWLIYYIAYLSLKKSKGFNNIDDYFTWLDEQKEIERKQGSDDMGDLCP